MIPWLNAPDVRERPLAGFSGSPPQVARGFEARANQALTPRFEPHRCSGARLCLAQMNDALPADLTPTALAAELKQRFGFDSFRPGQQEVVRDILARPRPARHHAHRRRQVAVLPTAGPASSRRVHRDIAVDRVDAGPGAPARRTTASTPRSSTPRSSAPRSSRRLARLERGELKLLYVAPERLLQAEFESEVLPRVQASRGISALVVDEAHCVSEWGHDFRPEYRQLHRCARDFADVPIAAFTATATERVRQDIVQQLALREPRIHVASFNRPNLYYAVRPKTRATYPELVGACAPR